MHVLPAPCFVMLCLAFTDVVQGVCLPKGMVRTFKVISAPTKDGKAQSGPLLSARQCDLDVLWQRAEQLCDASIQVRQGLPGPSRLFRGCPPIISRSLCWPNLQHKENLRVTVEGANNGGLLSRVNGLSLFVPVSQLEKKGHNEWWTEQVGGAATRAVATPEPPHRACSAGTS